MDLAERVRGILGNRGLSLNAISRRSSDLFGRSSPFFVPHNLYYELTRDSRKPTIQEIFTLSQLSDYRLFDWLRVFEFRLDLISQLQLLIPRTNTTLLDSTVYNDLEWIPWFTGRPQPALVPAVVPLTHLLAPSPARQIRQLAGLSPQTFLYARIGERDLHAHPQFAPGSIVRVDSRRLGASPVLAGVLSPPDPYFLIEHDGGWTCSQLAFLERNRVLLRCGERSYAERELKIGEEARVLGVIDAELRQEIFNPRRPESMAPLSGAGGARLLLDEQPNLKDLLRHARTRASLTFREASSISRWIADRLSNNRYFAAASTLSDFETISGPPRQIEKIITLCLIYSIGFREILCACGLPPEKEGKDPIPEELMPPAMIHQSSDIRADNADRDTEPRSFLATLLRDWEEIPLFLRFSLAEITGIRGFSASDVFWIGGTDQRHPSIGNAILASVNRRARKPPRMREVQYQPPLYIILSRDGKYSCGRCTLDDGTLSMHGCPRGAVRIRHLRNGADAEVVGRVTATLRRLF